MVFFSFCLTLCDWRGSPIDTVKYKVWFITNDFQNLGTTALSILL